MKTYNRLLWFEVRTILFFAAVSYFSTAFYAWKINPGEWESGLRGGAMALFIVPSIFVGAIGGALIEKEK